MKLTKEQKNFRKQMNKLKREGRVRDEYGRVVRPNYFSFDAATAFKVVLSLSIVIAILGRFGLLSMFDRNWDKRENYSDQWWGYNSDGDWIGIGGEYLYSFEKCDPALISSGSNILNLYMDEPGIKHSKFIGQVLTLFGEPDYWTKDYENIFMTSVAATDKDGNTIYLYIYHGPSGPAIGGGNDEDSRRAAIELYEHIINAEPTDYDWSGVYEDVGVTVRMGVRNGVPYYK